MSVIGTVEKAANAAKDILGAIETAASAGLEADAVKTFKAVTAAVEDRGLNPVDDFEALSDIASVVKDVVGLVNQVRDEMAKPAAPVLGSPSGAVSVAQAAKA